MLRSCLLLTVMHVAQVLSLKQMTIVDPSRKVYLGTKDSLDGSLDDRIVESAKQTQINTSDVKAFSQSLGLKGWGPVQVSLLMKEYPSELKNSLERPICMVKYESIEYKVNSQVNTTGSHYIYDYDAHDQFIFLVASNSAVAALELVESKASPDKNESQGVEFNVRWVVESLEDFVLSELGLNIKDAGLGYYKKRNLIFIPTDVALIYIDFLTGEKSIVAKDNFHLRHSITAVEVFEDFLFIGYEFEGIEVYDISNPKSVKCLGLIGKQQLNLKTEDTLVINHFLIHHHHVEFVYSDPQPIVNKPKETFFNSDVTPAAEAASIALDNMQFRFILLAEKSGLFIINIENLLKTRQLDVQVSPHRIFVTNVLKMSRYHNTIYTLTNDYSNIADPHSIKSIVNEIFLLDPKPSSWNDKASLHDTLFTINRRTFFDKSMENVYSDESYFYVIGNSTHHVYERAIPLDYKVENSEIATTIYEPNVFGLTKVILNQKPYLTSFGSKGASEFSISISDPVIICSGKQFPKGRYVLELNATSRDCLSKQKPNSDLSQTTRKLCVWKQEIVVQRGEDGYDHEDDEKFVRAIKFELFFMIGLVLIVILVMTVGYMIKRHLEMKRMYDKLKLEISISKDSRNFVRASSGSTDGQHFEAEDGKPSPSKPDTNQDTETA